MLQYPDKVEHLDVVETYQTTRIWKDLALEKVKTYDELTELHVKGLPIVIVLESDKKHPKVGYFGDRDKNSVQVIAFATSYHVTKERFDTGDITFFKILNGAGINIVQAQTNKIDETRIEDSITQPKFDELLYSTDVKHIKDINEVIEDFEQDKYLIVFIKGKRYLAIYDKHIITKVGESFIGIICNGKSIVLSKNSINNSSYVDNINVLKIVDYDDFIKRYSSFV